MTYDEHVGTTTKKSECVCVCRSCQWLSCHTQTAWIFGCYGIMFPHYGKFTKNCQKGRFAILKWCQPLSKSNPVIRIYSPSDSILFLWYLVFHIRKQIPGKLRDSLAFWTNASRASTRLPPHPVNQGTQAAITWPNARYLRESPRESAKQTPRILGAWSSVCLLYIYILYIYCNMLTRKYGNHSIMNNNSMPW